MYMKKIYLVSLLWLCSLWSQGQTTSIPDANFEQALIDLGYDDKLDGGVLTANVSGVTSLDVSSKSISDLATLTAALAASSCGLRFTSSDGSPLSPRACQSFNA